MLVTTHASQENGNSTPTTHQINSQKNDLPDSKLKTQALMNFVYGTLTIQRTKVPGIKTR